MKTIDYKVPNGKLLKIKLVTEFDKIKSITILGDFFLHPESTIDNLERALEGCKINVTILTETIENVLEHSNATLIGAQASDIAIAIEKAFSS